MIENEQKDIDNEVKEEKTNEVTEEKVEAPAEEVEVIEQEKVEQASDDGRDLATLEQTLEDATAPDEQALPDTSIPSAAQTTPSVDMPNPVAQTQDVPTAATGN